MFYLEKEPDTRLSDFVKCFWFSDSEETQGIHTVLPDGYFDLLYRFEGGRLVKVFLTGTWTKPIDVVFVKHTRFFGVRFKLLASEYLFKLPIEKIIDTALDLPDHYWTEDKPIFFSHEVFTAHMTTKIGQLLPEPETIDQRKFRLLQILYNRHGSITVNELAEQVGWSPRQINRWFNKQFGLPLKTFANILKCHAAYQHIAQGEFKPVGDYYDQAHFIKEVKRFTGATPKILHENKNVRFLQLSTTTKK
jgi:AraC-like DNA-binding protein